MADEQNEETWLYGDNAEPTALIEEPTNLLSLDTKPKLEESNENDELLNNISRMEEAMLEDDLAFEEKDLPGQVPTHILFIYS